MVVQIGVAETASEQNGRMVQQRSIPIGRRLQLFKERSQRRNVIGLDLDQLRQILSAILMVRYGVMRLRYANKRMAALAHFSGHQ